MSNEKRIWGPAMGLMIAGAMVACGGDDTTTGSGSSGSAGSGVAGHINAGGSGVGGTSGTGGTAGTGGAGGTAGTAGTGGTGGVALLDGGPLEAGCLASQKVCGGACVEKTNPAFGCTATGCSSCNMTATATCAPAVSLDAGLADSSLLADGAAADAGGSFPGCIGTCAPGYEDLDGVTANGCETKTPAIIQAATLQLWLRSDRGTTCASDAGVAGLSLWKDQSGKAHDATTPVTALTAQPQCTTAAAGINQLPTVHFSRTGDFTTDDGTLAVDLSFLAAASYTVFAVDRRTDVVTGESFILGSMGPMALTDCAVTSNLQKAFRFGYRSNTEFGLGQLCGGDLVATVAGTDVATKPVSLDIGWFSTAAGAGHKIERGAAVGSDAALVAVAAVTGGAIGRGYTTAATATDTRFSGDLAEIVIYNSALADADKAAVVAYLKTHWHL